MFNRTRGWLIVLFGLALAVLPSVALRASAAGVVFTAGRPVAPAVAFAPNNNSHLLVWAEDKGTGNGLDLFALRLAASGLPTGREIPVIVGPGNQSDPALIFNDRLNQFMLVYTDDTSGTGGGVPGVPTPVPPPIPGPPSPPLPPPPIPLDLDGTAGREAMDISRALAEGRDAGILGSIDSLNDSAIETDFDSTVQSSAQSDEPFTAQSTTHSIVTDSMPAVIRDTRTDGGAVAPTLDEETIRRAILGTSRSLQPPPPPPPSTAVPPTPGAPPPPPVAPGSRDIHGVWLSTYGTRTSITFPIVTAPSDDTFPDITYRPNPGTDQYILAWREVNGVDVALASVRLRGTGHFFYVDFKRTVVTGGDIGRPSVAAEFGKGEYFVAWSQTPKDAAARNVYGRLLNTNGVPYRAAYAVAASAADQVYPSLASLGSSGGYILVWEERNAGDPPDIKTRRLNVNARPYRSHYSLAGGTPFSFAPDVSTSGAFSTLVVWLDRNAAGDHSILSAEINQSGRRLGPERLVVQGGMGPAGVTPVLPPAPGPPVPPPPVP